MTNHVNEARQLTRRLLSRRPAPADEKDLENLLRLLNAIARGFMPANVGTPDRSASNGSNDPLPPEVWLG